MKERPILFSGAMVRAILDGTKTQTRRVVNGVPDKFMTGDVAAITNGERWAISKLPERVSYPPGAEPGLLCHYGQPGDRLWVREAWNVSSVSQLAPGESIGKSADACARDNSGFACSCSDGVVYKADGTTSHPVHGAAVWRLPMFMPRWASRITLEVTGVRVERLQDISEADAMAEGIKRTPVGRLVTFEVPGTDIERLHPVVAYEALWNSINAKTAPWASNPWVWVIEFKRHSPEDIPADGPVPYSQERQSRTQRNW